MNKANKAVKKKIAHAPTIISSIRTLSSATIGTFRGPRSDPHRDSDYLLNLYETLRGPVSPGYLTPWDVFLWCP